MHHEEFSFDEDHRVFTVLIPLDGTPFAVRSIPMATKLLGIFQGQIQLVRIIPPEHTPAIEKEANIYLEQIHQQIAQDGHIVEHLVATGDPSSRTTLNRTHKRTRYTTRGSRGK